MLRVFIDTSIARYADRERHIWVSTKKTVRWGSTTQQIDLVQPHTEYPLEKLNTEEHAQTYADAQLITKIEELAKANLISLYWHFETHWEFVRNKPLGIPVPPILKLIQKANCPIYYSRMVAPPFKDEDEQFEFLRHFKHADYEKWKKIVGAQPDTKRERNQLMDAWDLWTAANNHCDYFLTMDYRLIQSVKSRKNDSTLRVVAPTQFLAEFKYLEPSSIAEAEAWRRIRSLAL